MTAEHQPSLEVVSDEAGRGPGRGVTPGTVVRLTMRAGGGRLPDEAVAAVKAGDPAAWEAAYLAYEPELKGFLMVRLSDRDDAAEAFSETFFRAFERVGSLRADTASGLRAWLYSIARNVAIDRLRTRRRVVFVPEATDRADLAIAEAGERLVNAEEAAQVRRAFAQLPEDDREVLWLRVCADLSSKEVGQIVGKRAGTIRMQQQRALGVLARRLER